MLLDNSKELQYGFANGEFVQRLSALIPAPPIDFAVGDIVAYKVTDKVWLHNKEIKAIGKHHSEWKNGKCIFIALTCGLLIPVKPERLLLQKEV